MKKLHRAWIVTIGCCLIQAGILGLIVNCRGIFFSPICTSLGIDLSAFTLYGVFYGVSCCIAIPFVPPVLNKVNLNILFAVLTICMSFLIISCSLFCEVWQWYVVASLQGICSAFLFSITTATLINNWFYEKKGLALGIASAAPGVTGALFNPIGASIINQFGWRIGYCFFGCMFLVIVLPAAFMVKLKPGKKESPIGEKKRAFDTDNGCSISDVKKMPAFYLMIVFSAIASTLTCYTQMLNNYGKSLGFSLSISSMLVSLSMLGGVLLKFVVGIVQDRKGVKKALSAASFFLLCAYMALLLGRINLLSYLGSFLSGTPMALTMVVMPVMVSQLFGNKDYSKIYGYITMSGNLFASLGITIFGAVIDSWGFTSSQILCVFLSLCIFVLGTVSFFFCRMKYMVKSH